MPVEHCRWYYSMRVFEIEMNVRKGFSSANRLAPLYDGNVSKITLLSDSALLL